MQSFLMSQYVVLINTTGLQKLECLGWPGIHCPQWKGTSNATTGPPPEPSESCPHFFFLWRFDPIPGHDLPLRDFAITPRHTTIGRTPLDKWSDRRRDPYLTTHNTHKRQTSMPPAGFEHAIPANECPQTHVLDHAATGIGARTYRPYFSRTHLFSTLRLFTPIDLFRRTSSTKFLHVFLNSYMFSPSQASWFYGPSNIPQRVKLWSSSLCSLLHRPVNSSLLLSNIRLPLPFSQT
jgi:hypothetical protein